MGIYSESFNVRNAIRDRIDFFLHPYFEASELLVGCTGTSPVCRNLADVEIKLDKEGCVLAASEDDVFKRIALCIDGPRRYASNASRLLGKEAIKQRHLRILGYEVVQIPYFEFNNLKNKKERVKYLHQKIFPKSYRFSW